MLVAVCDDNQQIHTVFSNALKKRYGNKCEVVCFSESDKLKSYIEFKRIPDCILMDIRLGDKNGISEIKKMIVQYSNIPVIFVTGYPEYCQDIFIDFVPYGLITKPIDLDKLYYYTDKLNAQSDQKDVIISVTLGKESNAFKLSDIMYIESDKRKIIYYTKSGAFEEYSKMSDALDKLKIGFIRCHKSFAVNYQHIKKFTKNKVILFDNTEVPVSRMYGDNARARYLTLKSQSLGM